MSTAEEVLRAYRLGVLQLAGPAEARNPMAGLAAVRAAAKAGYPPAMFRLGVMLAIGRDAPRNDVEAATWIRAADEARGEPPPAEEPDEPPMPASIADGPLRDAPPQPPSLRAMRQALREAAQQARASLDVDMLSAMEVDLFDPDTPRGDTLEKVVAQIFRYGLGLPPDRERARDWMMLAAEVGDREAQVQRGVAAIQRQFQPAEARRWLTPAARAGDLEASRWLDWLDDLDRAENRGGLALGILLANADGAGGDWEGPDPERAARLLERLAQDGDPAAAGLVAWLYLVGRGVEADPAAAARWYDRTLLMVAPQLAADPEATAIDLGGARVLDVALTRLQLGAIAVRPHLEAAAAAGDAAALMALAEHLSEGLGGPVDQTRANALQDAAAAAGHPDALYWRNNAIAQPGHLPLLKLAADAGHLGCAMIAGRELIESNLPAALGYLERAAHGKEVDAEYLLGELHRDGLPGREPDWAVAAGWFARAARQGHWAASLEAGRMYRDGGHGQASDMPLAREMYALASDLGDAQAMLTLGIMLVRGEGGPPDARGAYALISQAAARGEADAEPWAARLRDQLPAAVIAEIDG